MSLIRECGRLLVLDFFEIRIDRVFVSVGRFGIAAALRFLLTRIAGERFQEPLPEAVYDVKQNRIEYEFERHYSSLEIREMGV
jgi:hypothetical protein